MIFGFRTVGPAVPRQKYPGDGKNYKKMRKFFVELENGSCTIELSVKNGAF